MAESTKRPARTGTRPPAARRSRRLRECAGCHGSGHMWHLCRDGGRVRVRCGCAGEETLGGGRLMMPLGIALLVWAGLLWLLFLS